VMPFFAPTINSFKRYQDGSWAPTRIAWSYDNRTAGFRVVGHGSGLRIECRIPGADCNPYLAYAAILASGLDGIANKLTPATPSDTPYEAQAERLPASLMEAVAALRDSAMYRAALGDRFVDYMIAIKDAEIARFQSEVTDWEQREYFEMF